jgi:hypothetical protein
VPSLFFAPSQMQKSQGARSSTGFSVTWLSFRISSVRFHSASPALFMTMMWLPAASFSFAGVLPTNLSSTKISAPSGSDVIVTVPNPCGVGLAYGSEATPAACVADEVVLETGSASEPETADVAASEPLLPVDETVSTPGATRAVPDPALSGELVEETVG